VPPGAVQDEELGDDSGFAAARVALLREEQAHPVALLDPEEDVCFVTHCFQHGVDDRCVFVTLTRFAYTHVI
jgi:hypothetical protein